MSGGQASGEAASRQDPVPPGGTPKSRTARWNDLHEDGPLDVAQLTAWVKQAAALPGWLP